MEFHSCCPGWSAMSRSWLTATSTSRVQDRKSTRLNSSHLVISYAVFCLKKKKTYLTMLSHLNTAIMSFSTPYTSYNSLNHRRRPTLSTEPRLHHTPRCHCATALHLRTY